ncbi:NCS2 family permease [Kineosporia sp. A_224]|uniref:NCS2 family permease n=1 Tax=Kineosporia sp. A_224 TaxID=1962180 RepID=UPI000B4B2EC0
MSSQTDLGTAAAPLRGLDSYFKMTRRGSSWGRELRGGVVTFFTMAYIVVLNPLIIGTQADSTGAFLGGGSVESAQAKVAVATAVVAGVMTILMGVVANYPLALAAGLGLNVFVTFGIAKLPGMTWEDAMGLVVLEGLILVVLVLTGFRTAVFHAVPPSLRIAISVGIGLFITIIGFVDSGFVRRTAVGPVPVELGVGGALQGWPTIVFLVGLVVISALLVRAVRGALLIGILVSTVLAIVIEAVFHVGPSVTASGDPNPTGWGLNVPTLPDQILATPDLDLLGRFSLLGSFQAIGIAAAVLLVFTLIVADFFDTMGTMVAVGAEGALLDADGVPPNADRILLVDSLAAAAGGAASVSSNTAYIESTAGVAEGARTGIASIVTGVLFLVAAVFAPLVRIVPYEAAAPALVVVGFVMMLQVRSIDWDDGEAAIPAFLTIVVMPFTYSITAGIGAGFVMYAVLKAVRGRWSEVHPLMWFSAGLFVVYFAIDPVKALLGVS